MAWHVSDRQQGMYLYAIGARFTCHLGASQKLMLREVPFKFLDMIRYVPMVR